VEEQRLTVSEALQFYTLGSAYASFEEEVKGSIEEGKLADLIVLSEDPFGALDIGDIAIELTLLGGEVVHGSLKKELVC